MTRIPDKAYERLVAVSTNDALLQMCVIKQNGIPVFWMTSSAIERVSGGKTYLPVNFRVRPPKKKAGAIPVLRLEISNVGQTLERLLLSDDSPDTEWTVDFFHVLTGDLDTPFERYSNFYVTGSPEYDRQILRLGLTPFDLSNRRFGTLIFDTEVAPGAHPR